MNRIILLTLVSIILSCTSQSPNNDLMKEKINGDVVEILEMDFDGIDKFGEYQLGYPEPNEYDPNEYQVIFNNYGNKIKEKYISHSDTVSEYEFSFDKTSRLDTTYINYFDPNQNYVDVYEYNELQKVKAVSRYNDNKLTSKSLFEYDQINMTETEKSYNGEGDLVSEVSDFLNQFGQIDSTIVSSTFYVFKQFLTYNNEGYEEKQRTLAIAINDNKVDESIIHFSYEYDDYGNWIKRISESSDKVEVTLRRITYSNGNVTNDFLSQIEPIKEKYFQGIDERAFENMINTISNIAANAQGYYIKPTMFLGGGNSFLGISFDDLILIKMDMMSNRMAEKEGYVYNILDVSKESFKIVVNQKGSQSVIRTAIITPSDLKFIDD